MFRAKSTQISTYWSIREKKKAAGSDSATGEGKRYALSQVMPGNVALVNVKKKATFY